MIPADAREAYDLVKKKLSLEPITGQIPESRLAINVITLWV
jgi:hypothetical protein